MGNTTAKEIKGWFITGLTRIEVNKEKIRYMVVECDTFSHEDYPVYLETEKEVKERLAQHEAHEVYDLEADMDEQLNAYRTWAVIR